MERKWLVLNLPARQRRHDVTHSDPCPRMASFILGSLSVLCSRLALMLPCKQPKAALFRDCPQAFDDSSENVGHRLHCLHLNSQHGRQQPGQ